MAFAPILPSINFTTFTTLLLLFLLLRPFSSFTTSPLFSSHLSTSLYMKKSGGRPRGPLRTFEDIPLMNDGIPLSYPLLRVSRSRSRLESAQTPTTKLISFTDSDGVTHEKEVANQKSSNNSDSKARVDEQLGILSRAEALKIASDLGVDLILLSSTVTPPLCKITDYSAYRYSQIRRKKISKKKSKSTEVKEIKMSYKIDTHDFNVRVAAARKFLMRGDRVKVGVWFKGREGQHSALGFALLKKFGVTIADIGVMEGVPKREGRSLSVFATVRTEILKVASDKRKAAERKMIKEERAGRMKIIGVEIGEKGGFSSSDKPFSEAVHVIDGKKNDGKAKIEEERANDDDGENKDNDDDDDEEDFSADPFDNDDEDDSTSMSDEEIEEAISKLSN